jgi:hypothetical protein
MRHIKTVTPILMLLAAVILTTGTAEAHQPYCEINDVTLAAPWQVPDASISYAYYGNLYPATDVDYFAFDARAGQSVLLSLSIPAIDGQEDFAPVMAVFGPGIAAGEGATLPTRVMAPAGQESFMVPLGEEPDYWFEPFGRRYYWNWDNYFFTAPETGTYTVALWHPDAQLGRYAFVIGQKERFGGDRACRASFDTYWTPLRAGENPYADAPADDEMHMHEDGAAHDHDAALAVDASAAPSVRLQVIPLDDGSYNVRVQTMNFTFAPQNVGQAPEPGEGHAHLYIDDEKIARLYGEWYHLASLPEDAETIAVGLYANNHQPLAVDGEAIGDTVAIAEIAAP